MTHAAITAAEYAEQNGGARLQCSCCGRALAVGHRLALPGAGPVLLGSVCARRATARQRRRKVLDAAIRTDQGAVQLTVYNQQLVKLVSLFVDSLAPGVAAVLAERAAQALAGPGQLVYVEAVADGQGAGQWYAAAGKAGLEDAIRKALSPLI